MHCRPSPGQGALAELAQRLPDGVEIIETYDRSALIQRAVNTLQGKLLEEFIVVVLVCALFLFHLRSALVIVISLPVGILVAFIVMQRRVSMPTSCHWAASPLPSAPWWMRPLS